MTPLKVGSLFAGYGGLDLGIQQVLDAETEWFCEFDEAPSKILKHHWPTVPNYGDVTKIDWETVPPVDIIAGGYPCQPFSRAGLRKGTNDERHLWPYVREAIRVLRPAFAILENVAGHRSMGFDQVLTDLATDGFDAQWATVRARDVGAPHYRERLFILVVPDPDRLGLEAGRLPSRQAEEVASNNSGFGPFPSHNRGVEWGEYAPAVRGWERRIGEAPDPVIVSDSGKPLLDTRFPEWMMGLPVGHVTAPEIGLTRAQQLKAIGNGVVPQQAAAALRILLGSDFDG